MTELHPQPVIRITAMPVFPNAYGDIFGGWLMSLMDMPYQKGDRGDVRRGGRCGIAAANHDGPSSSEASCAGQRGFYFPTFAGLCNERGMATRSSSAQTAAETSLRG